MGAPQTPGKGGMSFPPAKKKQGAGKVRALPPQPSGGASVANVRRKRLRRLQRTIALWVGVPTVLATLYYCFLASPQYESVTSFTVQSADGRGSGNIAGLLGGLTGTSSTNDALVIRDFIQSRDMMQVLVEKHDILKHFRDPSIDQLSRLPEDPTLEEAYEYYLDQIDVYHDTESGVVTLSVRAFDAESAQAVAQTIVDASEAMVNRMSAQAQRDAIAFAEKEVERAQSRVSKARQSLMKAQGEGEQFNPMAAAASVQGIVSQLEGELAKKRAELRANRATYGPAAPEVIRLREHVASLEREVERQRRRLVDTDDGEAVSTSIARFEPIAFEKEFAERALQSALTSMEMARVDAARQHRYLAVVSAPSRPDAPTHPDELLAVLRVLVLSLVVVGLGGLVLASIREHAKV